MSIKSKIKSAKTDGWLAEGLTDEEIKETIRSAKKGDGMAEYHVRCGLCDIYAGTLKASGEEWRNKSVVTDEAINAVAQHMLTKVKDGETAFAYAMQTHNGKYLRLKLEVSDTLPNWVNE